MRFRRLVLLACILLLASNLSWAARPDSASPCDIAAPGDFDADGDVDMNDLGLLEDCAVRPDRPGCSGSDLNGDGRTDEADFETWQTLYTGAGDCGPNLREPPQPPPGEPFRGESPAPVPVMADTRTAHSLYLFSGEFYLSAEDLRIKGRGPDFVWARKYRSRLGPHTAMGQGWDFSYNIRIERAGPHMRLLDGNTRSDVYYRQANGTWVRPELFRVLATGEDGSHSLVFADMSRWGFRPLDESAAAGKIAQIVDRNGNALSFNYDSAGRLTDVVDTLGRTIAIAYNVHGYIAAVTDFTGRMVTYSYYQEEEEGGSEGDLKSVSGPMMPDSGAAPARSTTYTYSSGFEDDRLNHNLLSITDAKGQTSLRNVYSSDPDRGDHLQFDRVVRQVWGYPDDNIDLVAVPQKPPATGNAAAVKVIVNDRVGNVHEYFYDARNRLVMARDYTGRADPDTPTTETENRPTSPLRGDDPDYFATWYEYNHDSLCTRIVRPNGNEELFTYDSGNEGPRSRGNLVRYMRLPGPLGGDQARIFETFEYDSSACCGSNRLTRWIDARGQETRHEYDARGNRIRTRHRIASIIEDFEYNSAGQLAAHTWPDNGSGQRRRDELTYYDSGPQRGYLESETMDAGGSALMTAYDYDALGRCTHQLSPGGHETLYSYNASDQLVRKTGPSTGEDDTRHQQETTYDANGHPTWVEVQALSPDGDIQPASTTRYHYDLLNRLIRKTQRVDSTRNAVTEYGYDANGNQVLVRSGEAVSGRQTANTVRAVYDERDLPFRVIRAGGSPAETMTRYDYDANGNRKRVGEGVESEPHATTYTHDGYNRLIRQTDAMGNAELLRYDAAGNLVSRRVEGELADVPGDSENVRLYEASMQYDPLGRLIRESVEHFEPRRQSALGKGEAATRYEYTDSSRLRLRVDDNGGEWFYTYDSAGRRRSVTDPRGNTQSFSYDAESNLVSRTEVERSDAGDADRTFVTAWQHDPYGNVIRETDSAGNVRTSGYDARGLQIWEIDHRGVESRRLYDGLGRLIRTTIDMNGDGAQVSDRQDITIRQAWDNAGRLVARADGNGTNTLYIYDAADRLMSIRYADGTSTTITRNVYGNATTLTDPNGSVISTTYDLLNRPTARQIKRGAGVGGTTFERYSYDGLSRLVAASNDDSADTMQYDSMSNLMRETQQVVPSGPLRTISGTYDGVGNRTRLLYPNGRILAYSYDRLNRPTQIREEGSARDLAVYRHAGREHMGRCELGNGTRLVFGHDAARRPISLRLLSADGTILDERAHEYDPAGNLLQQRWPAETSLSRGFSYDAAERLIGSRTSPDGPHTDYTLDRAGNRLRVDGGANAGTYILDTTTPEPADLQMNQYTAVPAPSAASNVAGLPRTYDRNGNLKTSHGNQRRYSYDYRNRLIEFTDVRGSLNVMYKYDPFGRRIEKNAGGMITRYYYTGYLNLEEQNQSHITAASYVYGPSVRAQGASEGIRDLTFEIPDCSQTARSASEGTGNFRFEISNRRQNAPGASAESNAPVPGASAESPSVSEEVWNLKSEISETSWLPLQIARPGQSVLLVSDPFFNTISALSGTGSLLERYRYEDFGRPEFAAPDGKGRPSSAIGNPWLFAGMRFDVESGLYYDGLRYLDPATGRYLTREPAIIWGDPLGNPYTYRNNNPWR